MAITLLTIPEGERFPDSINRLQPMISGLLMAHAADIELLVPGEYNVTPDIWTLHSVHSYLHKLEVFDNGEGVYGMSPRSLSSVYREGREVELRSHMRSGHEKAIDKRNPIAIIAGEHPAKVGAYIFGLINYFEPLDNDAWPVQGRLFH